MAAAPPARSERLGVSGLLGYAQLQRATGCGRATRGSGVGPRSARPDLGSRATRMALAEATRQRQAAGAEPRAAASSGGRWSPLAARAPRLDRLCRALIEQGRLVEAAAALGAERSGAARESAAPARGRDAARLPRSRRRARRVGRSGSIAAEGRGAATGSPRSAPGWRTTICRRRSRRGDRRCARRRGPTGRLRWSPRGPMAPSCHRRRR